MIKSFSEDARGNLGNDLSRLERGEKPLDFSPMGAVLPGVFELRERDKDHWYRLLYIALEGWIFVLHCFTKKSNETPRRDVEIARERLKNLRLRIAEQKRRKGNQ